MRNYSRFIPGEEIDAVEQWNFGAIDTASQILAAQVKAREDAEVAAKGQAIQQQGYQIGFNDGVAQGRLQAQADLQRQMDSFLATQAKQAGEQLSGLLAAAQAQLADAEQAMAQEVLELSCEVARQVVRRELSIDTHALLPVIREALELLGTQHKNAVVRLNPADVEVLQAATQAEFVSLALTLRADPSVAQGGCLLESSGTVVDGTLPKRWQRAVANLGLSSPWDEPHDAS